jgi:flagellar FliJ protein
MATPSAIETLIDLASKSSDEAARRLGRAVKAGEDAQQKLALLVQYRDDYANRLQTKMMSGFTASSYRNFQFFLNKLDEAIKGQQHVIQSTQRRVDDERRAWQGCERKRLSYDTLATRMRKVQHISMAKREQKQTDEFAARKLLYK